MMLRRMAMGGARPRDLDVLLDVAKNVGGRKTLCALGDFAVAAVGSSFRLFKSDLEQAVTARAESRGNGHAAGRAERTAVHV
jgi:NADH:ubiquinone oxidoreductase subunit F (NADH-binding)